MPARPQIGFNVEHVKYKNLDMTIWDVGGQDKIRPLWKHYYEKTDALIYVVDSNDASRLDEARDALHKVMNEDAMRNAVLLVLANKQDLPRAVRADEIASRLGLSSLRGTQWYVQPCSASIGDGVYEGLEWTHGALRRREATAPAA